MAQHSKNKQFAVIGLGRFGFSVAQSLAEMGYEVLAVDQQELKVQEVANIVTHAVAADSTDEGALGALGIRNFDVVIVAIGENIQASILTTLILKELEVPYLIAKAANELHGKVLHKIGANQVIYPERDMGLRVAHGLISPNVLDHTELSNNLSIADIKLPKHLVGKSLRQLEIHAHFSCHVLGVKRGQEIVLALATDERLQGDDVLMVIGANRQLTVLEQAYAEK